VRESGVSAASAPLAPVIPCCHDQAAISTRLRTPSVAWIRAMCDLTVLSEMNSAVAISLLVRPLATRATYFRYPQSLMSVCQPTEMGAAGPSQADHRGSGRARPG
jgi:hypothetical protein